MLFDLQGSRKSAVRVIYLGLAILMGGGLVLFGVGSSVQGGLFDAFTGSSNGAGQYKKAVVAAQKKVDAQPKNPVARQQLIRARYNLSGTEKNFNQKTGKFTKSGKVVLTSLGKDWDAYIKVVDKPDPQTALFAVQAFVNLEDAKGAMSAQRVVAEERPEAAQYLALMQYALAAGDSRIAELSQKKALSLAKKQDRPALKKQIKALKKQYKDQQKGQLSSDVQKQVQDQINQKLGGGGGLGGAVPLPAPAPDSGAPSTGK
ncbi:MAG: hypothetical protein JHC87_00635 [Thermoleophilaceae bacterium]|nr:hypothetical protein [Thermoleophilaceae bacterium]